MFSSIDRKRCDQIAPRLPLMRQFSKSKTIAFRQCPKRLQLEKDSEVADEASQDWRLD